jgi:hypothetical protein
MKIKDKPNFHLKVEGLSSKINESTISNCFTAFSKNILRFVFGKNVILN